MMSRVAVHRLELKLSSAIRAIRSNLPVFFPTGFTKNDHDPQRQRLDKLMKRAAVLLLSDSATAELAPTPAQWLTSPRLLFNTNGTNGRLE